MGEGGEEGEEGRCQVLQSSQQEEAGKPPPVTSSWSSTISAPWTPVPEDVTLRGLEWKRASSRGLSTGGGFDDTHHAAAWSLVSYPVRGPQRATHQQVA